MKLDFEDDELDKLFKSKAKSVGEEPAFNEAAWADMEGRLNKRKRRFAFYYLSAAVLFLGILSFGWLLLKSDRWDGKGTEKNYTTKNEFLKPGNKAFKNDSLQEKLNKVTTNQPIINSEKLTTTPSSKNNFVKADTPRGNDRKPQKKQDRILDNASIALNEILTKSTVEIVKNEKEISLIKREQPIYFTENSGVSNELIIKPILYQKALTEAKSGTKPSMVHSKVTWSLGFNAGPEFNTAGSLNKVKGNFNGGISFSGKLKKFNLSLGVNYGIKNYSATPYQYQNIKPQFIPLITNINATCNILEVPLSLSYQIFSNKKSSFDLNAGLSSYFMLKEKYVYQYTAISGYADRTVQVNNQNQHYFKVLQLSGTYYLPLRNSANQLGIEPFAKLPLAGVGSGAVDLKSYGVNLHFNYQLKKK
ncbi:MAG: hypothetical protein KKE39_10345 [Bacteroidetes bacterium]|nr:hypothetical protein [Bacteroidota bacterium]MBU1373960.1 hypothetical protein [Bacteroidota bacterium]MBU1485312.1 hypothetical protein [Bacteroidota bacterium]MBU1761297.1 hypothetical protein [Bacteroidota bacterium]MBU2268859.1 hypothetical protein [Bacteroidota bacterium]